MKNLGFQVKVQNDVCGFLQPFHQTIIVWHPLRLKSVAFYLFSLKNKIGPRDYSMNVESESKVLKYFDDNAAQQ